MREILDRGIVLDVCPVSNLRTRAVPSLNQHPLPQLVEYGIACSISTDDPEMFDTDLSREYELATSFGIAPRAFFEAGITGALCDEQTKKELAATAQVYPWPAAPARTSRFPVGPD